MNTGNPIEDTLTEVMHHLDELAATAKAKADRLDANYDSDTWAATIATGEYIGIVSAYHAVMSMLVARKRSESGAA